MLSLREINADNFWDIIDLDVHPEQRNLVTSNAVSIAQSKVQPECIPLAIYHDQQPVGFVMYCIDRDDSEYWLYRLMIDARYQGNGYGRQAMIQVIDRIKQDKSRNKIFLGADPAGVASVKLYQSLGFVFTGQVFGKEHIMVLNY